MTAHHAFILLLFPARYTDLVHSIREKRPRVSAARRAGLFSLSLSLPFFTVAAGNRPVFAESGRGLFLSLDRIQTAHDPIDRDSESALRTGTDQIRRSQGRESDTLHRKGREREREKALTTVARIDLALPLLFSSPARKCSHVHFETRKVFVRSAIAAKLDDGTRRVTFGTISSKLLQGFIM